VRRYPDAAAARAAREENTMPIRPRLIRSIPFWILVVASLASAAAGAYLLADRLGSMTATLTTGTATGVDVYVGQSVALLGAVLVGAGVVGVLLALGIAAAATLRPVHPVESAQPASEDASTVETDFDADLDAPVDGRPVAEPVTEPESIPSAR
jgi:hypothetical protein